MLTYAGLSAPKRRNDGKTCSHMASGNDTSKHVQKTGATHCLDVSGDRTFSSGNENQRSGCKIMRSSHSKEQNNQTSTSSKAGQDNHSKVPFQLSNNTAMRLYNSSHPHRENHQRLSSRRQTPYASAPSSPWKSANSSTSSSTYLCPTVATQARQNGSFSRSQIIQREEIFGSDPSLSLMSRSTNGGIIISNGHSKTTNKYNRSCSANSEHTSHTIQQPLSSLSRSHEEQSSRLNHRVLELGGSLSPKHQWLASGPSGLKVSNVATNGGLTNKLSNNQPTSSSCLSRTSLTSSTTLSSSTKRKSGNYQSVEKSLCGSTMNQTSRSNRNSGRSGFSNISPKPCASTMNEKSKRKSFGSAPPCNSSMSKSDSVAYKAASKTLRCPEKGSGLKAEEETPHLTSKVCSFPQQNNAISSSLTLSNGSSTLISSSLLSKVRYH